MSAAAEVRPVRSESVNLPAVRAFTDNSEFDLIVACCADSCGHDSSYERHADHIPKILSRPLDWERILRLVDHHRVVPRVYGSLSVLSHLVPTEPLDALRSRYQNNARKTLWFTAEMVRILTRLESAGIKALPYKGPDLAQALYGEVTERQFGDLDILILPADAPKAKAALLDLGYKPGIELASRAESAYLERAYVETGYEYSFKAARGSNLVELQWRIVPRFYSVDFDVADFLERADEIMLGGRRMRTLRAEDLLLVLCVHAAKHVWIQLSWLCDIAQLVKSSQLDWDAIHDEARRLGIERIVTLNLFLAHELLGSAMPPAIQKRLGEDPSTIVLADEILRVIKRSVHYDTESIPYFRLMMRLRERWQDRARFLWRLAVTPGPSEWLAVRLPESFQLLYRLMRLCRLAKRLASTG
jgi:Uncharacterised nucleotidyltransferase